MCFRSYVALFPCSTRDHWPLAFSIYESVLTELALTGALRLRSACGRGAIVKPGPAPMLFPRQQDRIVIEGCFYFPEEIRLSSDKLDPFKTSGFRWVSSFK